MLTVDSLAAPHLMPVEAANFLRRLALSGAISADAASLAHRDLLDLRVELFPYEPFATRIWALREHHVLRRLVRGDSGKARWQARDTG